MHAFDDPATLAVENKSVRRVTLGDGVSKCLPSGPKKILVGCVILTVPAGIG
jgi:hypothetical protein